MSGIPHPHDSYDVVLRSPKIDGHLADDRYPGISVSYTLSLDDVSYDTGLLVYEAVLRGDVVHKKAWAKAFILPATPGTVSADVVLTASGGIQQLYRARLRVS